MSRQTVRAGNVGVGQFRLPGSRTSMCRQQGVPASAARRIELRADILNAFNWINYAAVQTNITASDFGSSPAPVPPAWCSCRPVSLFCIPLNPPAFTCIAHESTAKEPQHENQDDEDRGRWRSSRRQPPTPIR